MTTPPVRVERRVGQRFPYLLALSLQQPSTGISGVGFTQDLSSRGVFFFTDSPLTEGAQVELTLRMPSEITLGESMPVRCRGRILRVVRPVGSSDESNPVSGSPVLKSQTKIGVAVRFEGYEYLSESADISGALSRSAVLHPDHDSATPRHDEDRHFVHSSARSVLG